MRVWVVTENDSQPRLYGSSEQPGRGLYQFGSVNFVKDGYNWVRINLEELQYVESDRNYLTFQETGKKTLTRMTIGGAVEMLPTEQFMRVHKSYIIAIGHIEKIERHQLTIGKMQVPLSGSYRDELLERVKQ